MSEKVYHRGREFDSFIEALEWRAGEDAKEAAEDPRREIILRIVEENVDDAASTASFLTRLMQGMDRHGGMSQVWTLTINGEPFQLQLSEDQRMTRYGPCEHCRAARDVRRDKMPDGWRDTLWCPSCGREAD